MDSPLIGLLLILVFPTLLSTVMIDRMSLEDFEDPGGWKFPKAEVVTLSSMIGGMVIGLVSATVIVG